MKYFTLTLKLLLLVVVGYGGWSSVRYLVSPIENELYDFSISRQKMNDVPVAWKSKMDQEEVARRVNRAWDRIESQLKKLAPADLKILRAGATEKEIQRLEATLGFPLMVDFRASLLRHNGTSRHFGVFQYFSVDEILETRFEQAYFDIEMDSMDNSDLSHENGTWEPGVLTIGIANFDLILECETGKTLIQERINYSGEHHDSFLDSLEYIAECLEEGHGYSVSGEGGSRTISMDGFACPHY